MFSRKAQRILIFIWIFLVLYNVNNWLPLATAWLAQVTVLVFIAWQITYVTCRKLNTRPTKLIKPRDNSILITGCDTGFGFLTALQLNKYGFNVFATVMFPDGDGAARLVDKAKFPSKIHIIGPFDVTKQADVDMAYDRVKSQLETDGGQLWAVVNNAGIFQNCEFEFGGDSVEPFERLLAVNAVGTVRVVRKFLPLLRKSKGRVINIASLAARLSLPATVGYAMSKYAVLALTDGLRREMYKFSVDVISIEPHSYATPMLGKTALVDMVNRNWDRSTDAVKSAYGRRYFDNYLKIVDLIPLFSRKNVEEIGDAVLEAATAYQPETSYICAAWYAKPFLWLGVTAIPIELFDGVMRLGDFFTGTSRPQPDNNSNSN